jgi:hypothetical protein
MNIQIAFQNLEKRNDLENELLLKKLLMMIFLQQMMKYQLNQLLIEDKISQKITKKKNIHFIL